MAAVLTATLMECGAEYVREMTVAGLGAVAWKIWATR